MYYLDYQKNVQIFLREKHKILITFFSMSIYRSVYSVKWVRGVYFKTNMLLGSLDISFLIIRCYIRVMKIAFNNEKDYNNLCHNAINIFQLMLCVDFVCLFVFHCFYILHSVDFRFWTILFYFICTGTKHNPTFISDETADFKCFLFYNCQLKGNCSQKSNFALLIPNIFIHHALYTIYWVLYARHYAESSDMKIKSTPLPSGRYETK